MGQDTDHVQSVRMWVQLYAPPLEAPATILDTVRCVLEIAYVELAAHSRICVWLKHEERATSTDVALVSVAFHRRSEAQMHRIRTGESLPKC